LYNEAKFHSWIAAQSHKRRKTETIERTVSGLTLQPPGEDFLAQLDFEIPLVFRPFLIRFFAI
jgi:hypothetical protein